MFTLKRSHIVIIIISLFVAGCNEIVNDNNRVLVQKEIKSSFVRDLNDTVIHLYNKEKVIEVSVLYAKNGTSKGTILALPGWAYPFDHWCDSTTFCDLALEEGYDLIMPTIGKSIYTKQIYPQTRKDWKEEVTIAWFEKVFIPYFQDSIGLLKGGNNNYIVGISTGARGALILAEEHPELFKAIALMSGDYDQNEFPQDNLYNGFFGTYSDFPDLYKGKENPMNSLDKLNCDVFISHGLEDHVVDPEHSKHLYNLLGKDEFHLFQLHLVSDADHDYQFWSQELTKVIDFFNSRR